MTYIPLTKRICIDCKSKKTYLNKNGIPTWMKKEKGWQCKKCWHREYQRRRYKEDEYFRKYHINHSIITQTKRKLLKELKK